MATKSFNGNFKACRNRKVTSDLKNKKDNETADLIFVPQVPLYAVLLCHAANSI